MVRAEEVRAQHAEGIFVDFDLVLPQMFPKEVPHQLTSSSAGLSVCVIERLRMSCLQQILTATPRQIKCAFKCQYSKLTSRVVNESDLCRCDLAVDSGWHHR